ncbi:MAG: hypothetical protein EP332_03530 [Bacteroidetes bacterium]|nr:MAG: hypothetical protein EP332_03530 [Bacteroidota bacterium]
MKSVLLLVLVFLIPFGLYAQSDSLKVERFYKNSKQLREVYYISLDSVKNGPYIEYNSKGKKLKEGRYTKDYPSGIWHYYENNNWNRLYSVFDWDTMKEIEYKYVSNRKRTSPSDSFCRFPGGEIVFFHYILEQGRRILTKFPNLEGKAKVTIQLEQGRQVKVVKTEWFDQEGKKATINSQVEAELKAMFEKMPAWLQCPPDPKPGFQYVIPILFT